MIENRLKSPFFVFIAILSIVASALAGCGRSRSTEWIHLSSKNGDIPAPGPSTQQTASLILDVDKDGLNDFVIGSRKTGPSVL